VLAPVRDSLLGADYANYLADRLRVDYQTVVRSIPRTPATRIPAPHAEGPPVAEGRPLTAEQRAERELVRLAAIAPVVRGQARDLLDEGAVSDDTARRLLSAVCEAGEATGQDLFGLVAGRDSEAAAILSAWLVDAQEVEQVEYAFREVASRVKELAVGRLILIKKAELRSLDPGRDAETYDRLFGEIAELQRVQQSLRDRGTGTTDEETEQTA
jgi:hypothetical protein